MGYLCSRLRHGVVCADTMRVRLGTSWWENRRYVYECIADAAPAPAIRLILNSWSIIREPSVEQSYPLPGYRHREQRIIVISNVPGVWFPSCLYLVVWGFAGAVRETFACCCRSCCSCCCRRCRRRDFMSAASPFHAPCSGWYRRISSHISSFRRCLSSFSASKLKDKEKFSPGLSISACTELNYS